MLLRRLLGAVMIALALYLIATPAYVRYKEYLSSVGMRGALSGTIALVSVALLIAIGGWLLVAKSRRAV